jgi:hypothetical protein
MVCPDSKSVNWKRKWLYWTCCCAGTLWISCTTEYEVGFSIFEHVCFYPSYAYNYVWSQHNYTKIPGLLQIQAAGRCEDLTYLYMHISLLISLSRAEVICIDMHRLQVAEQESVYWPHHHFIPCRRNLALSFVSFSSLKHRQKLTWDVLHRTSKARS